MIALTALIALSIALAGAAFYLWRKMALGRVALSRKDQEAKAVLELNASMRGELDRLQAEAEREKGRLALLCLAISLAEGYPGPLELGRELLNIIQQGVNAEYACFTLVNPDGTLGERADRFQGMPPCQVSAHPGGLAEAVLRGGRTQQITDTVSDSRANPALVAAGIRSYIALAIKGEDRVVGILFLHSTRADAFKDDRAFLESFASLCALPLQKANLFSVVEEAKQELESVFDAVPDGVVLVDSERRVLRANQAFARIVGRPIQTLAGATVCKLLHGRDDPLHRCPLDKSLAGEQPEAVFREPHLNNSLVRVRTYPLLRPANGHHRLIQIYTVSLG